MYFPCLVKILVKKHIIREKKVPYVSREKEVMAMTNHPLLVKLFFTFQDKENLCIFFTIVLEVSRSFSAVVITG